MASINQQNNYNYSHIVNHGNKNKIKCPKAVNPGLKSYAISSEGDCLLPEYNAGSIFMCDPDQEPVVGDLVVIWWTNKNRQPWIKVLDILLPPKEWWNLKGEAAPLVIVSMKNPPESISIPLSEIDQIHKIIYVNKA